MGCHLLFAFRTNNDSEDPVWSNWLTNVRKEESSSGRATYINLLNDSKQLTKGHETKSREG